MHGLASREAGGKRGGMSVDSFWHAVARDLLSEDLDAGLSRLIERLGRTHRADRVWVIRYNEELTHFWNTHEWVRAGVTPFLSELQGTPVKLIHWLHAQLLAGKTVRVDDIETMPRQARALQAEFRRQGNAAVLCVPVFNGKTLIGIIGYDAVGRRPEWTAQDIVVLEQVAELTGRALMRPGLAMFAPEPGVPHVFLRQGKGFISVPREQIRWIEAARDYSAVWLSDGRRVLELRSLQEWDALLPKEQFVRVHRGYIVNLGGIQAVDRTGGVWHVEIKGLDQRLPVGRTFRRRLRQLVGF